jgi:uncharacterized protein (TIGR02300 family)
MPAKDLGVKHTCWKCGTKFYDLKKPDPACPKCGTDPRQAPAVKAPPPAERRRAREEALEEVVETVEETEVDEDLEEEAEEPEESSEEDA